MELGVVQANFADIIWELEPVSSSELVKVCKERLNWTKSTTYTVLKKLCEKGLFRNDGGIVTAVISREDYYYARSEEFVQETYQGSLPAFFAAFAERQKLTEKEMDEIQQMIDAYRKK